MTGWSRPTPARRLGGAFHTSKEAAMTASRFTPYQVRSSGSLFRLLLFWTSVLLAARAAFAVESPPAGPYDVTRERMGDWEPKAVGWVNTSDGLHMAFTYEKKDQRFVSFDGKPGPPFFDIASVGISIS